MLLERERWERTLLAPFPIWSSVLHSACTGGMIGAVIVGGWHGFTAAAIAGNATAWLLIGIFAYCVYLAVVVVRGRSLLATFAKIGPFGGIALFLAPFVNELIRVDPSEYLATLTLVVTLLMIPYLVKLSIRIRRFV